MPRYWVRNKKGQVAAELSERGTAVHDQALSWQLYRLKQEGGIPVTASDGSESRAWNLDTLLEFVKQDGYTVELKESVTQSDRCLSRKDTKVSSPKTAGRWWNWAHGTR